jgi:hypothetical protein
MNEQNIIYIPVKLFEMGNVVFIAGGYREMKKLREKLGIDAEIKDVTANWKEDKKKMVEEVNPIPVMEVMNCGETILNSVGGLRNFLELKEGMWFLDKMGDKEMGRGTNA